MFRALPWKSISFTENIVATNTPSERGIEEVIQTLDPFLEMETGIIAELESYTEIQYQKDLSILRSLLDVIVFIGISGSGKSTQQDLLGEHEGFFNVKPYTNRLPCRIGEDPQFTKTTKEIEDLHDKGNGILESFGDTKYLYHIVPNSVSLVDACQAVSEFRKKYRTAVIGLQVPVSVALSRVIKRVKGASQQDQDEALEKARERLTNPISISDCVDNFPDVDLLLVGTLDPNTTHRILVKKLAEILNNSESLST